MSLRNHPTYLEFMKKWQLPVYFQLRFREIIKDIEPFLSDLQQSVVVHNSKGKKKKEKEKGDRLKTYWISSVINKMVIR